MEKEGARKESSQKRGERIANECVAGTTLKRIMGCK
jgi:hypothetical protein